MDREIGKVIKVFIPTENNIDIMNSNKIGFEIEVNNKTIKIIEEQDEINSNILKDDKVIISKEKINDIEYLNIDKLEGEYYD